MRSRLLPTSPERQQCNGGVGGGGCKGEGFSLPPQPGQVPAEAE